jgi:hypothetical protein
MCDEDKSVSIAVNRKQVRSSGHCRAVFGVMSVMRNARCQAVKWIYRYHSHQYVGIF